MNSSQGSSTSLTRDILSSRQSTYGDYTGVSRLTDQLYKVVQPDLDNKLDSLFNSSVRVSTFMILNKLARAVNGDASYKDTWDDISGYALLISNQLENKDDE